MNVNPMQFLQMMKNGMNPQQLVMSFLQQQQGNNPILQNAVNLAQGGNSSALQMIARNLASQKGINFDQAFSDFQNNLLK